MSFNPSAHVPVGTGQQVPTTPSHTVVVSHTHGRGQPARQLASNVNQAVHRHVGADASRHPGVPARDINARQLPGTGKPTAVYQNSVIRR